jgi:hypothetical protein
MYSGCDRSKDWRQQSFREEVRNRNGGIVSQEDSRSSHTIRTSSAILHADMHAQGCMSQLLSGDFVFALFFRVPGRIANIRPTG